MSDIVDMDFVFDGVNGLAGDVFVRNIRRRVLAERIHQDDELIAHTAASCLQGPALEWYEDQTDETQESWKLLRRAILARWPPSSAAPASASSSASSNMPTPAAAPPNPAAVPAIASSKMPIGQIVSYDSPKNGRVRVVSMDGRFIGYMATTLNKLGHLQVTSAIPDVAIIRLTPNGPVHDMEITNYEGEVVRVGVTWTWAKSSQELSEEIASWGALVKITSDGSGQRVQSSNFYSGPWGSDVWSISTNGQLLISWEVKPRLHRDMDITYGTTLSVANNFEEYKKVYDAEYTSQASRLITVKLFFEPV